LLILVLEGVIFLLGAVNTSFSNGNPKIMDIYERREKKYITEINNLIDQLQKIDDDTYATYKLFYKNNAMSASDAYKDLNDLLIKTKSINKKLERMNPPGLFSNFHNLFTEAVLRKIGIIDNLIKYTQQLNPGLINQYKHNQDIYRQKMQETTEQWLKLTNKNQS